MKKTLWSLAGTCLAFICLPISTQAQGTFTYQLGYSYQNGLDSDSEQLNSSLTVTGAVAYAQTLTVTNGLPQQVFLSGVSTAGVLVARDVTALGTAGATQIGGTNGNFFARLEPGAWALVPLDGTNIFVNTTSGTHTLRLKVRQK